MFVFCSQFLCKWMINFHNRRLWLGSSCVGRSGFHGPDLRWMDGSCPALWLVTHSQYSALIGRALTESTWAGDWQELVTLGFTLPSVASRHSARTHVSPVSPWSAHHGLPLQGPAARDHPPQEAGAHRSRVLYPGAGKRQAPRPVWMWVSCQAPGQRLRHIRKKSLKRSLWSDIWVTEHGVTSKVFVCVE